MTFYEIGYDVNGKVCLYQNWATRNEATRNFTAQWSLLLLNAEGKLGRKGKGILSEIKFWKLNFKGILRNV
jgi:hypothetical protein